METPNTIVEIEEMSNTWGCSWHNPNGKEQFGFSTWPHSAGLWLRSVSGSAVEQILEAGLGTIVGTHPGAYGGTCRTISVNRDELEAMCHKLWNRVNAASKPQKTCHYCGMPATGTGFFGEAVCDDCK